MIGLAAALGLTVMAGAGCRRVPLDQDENFRSERISARETSDSISLNGARRLDAHIEMGVGELRVSSAESSEAIATDFEYDVDSWRPEVSYEVTGDTGVFDIEQPDVRGLRDLFHDGAFDGARYSWDIGLPTGVPTDLQLDFGVGDAEVFLGGLMLEELRVNAGVGDMTIDLTGDWAKSFDARIEAGVGNVTLRVPRDVGVRIEGRHDGVGNYDADGMMLDGDAFVNDAYGTSPVTLDIELRRGVGDVTVELAD